MTSQLEAERERTMAEFRRVMPEPLQAFAREIVRGMGSDDEVAAEVAQHLVRANLSGHDSHGVMRIPQYIRHMDEDGLRPGARPHVIHETTVTALIDAERTFGHFSTMYALEWAVARAKEHGIAAAAVRHSAHVGRLGEYTERAGAAGLVSIVTMGIAGLGTQSVVPFGGAQRFFGTNPWTFGVPVKDGPPMVFDAATSVVAEGKIRFAQAKGAPAPHGAIVDSDGNPTTNPDDFYGGGALLPVGGPLAGHKGYGLAMASALIAGLSMIDDDAITIPSVSVRDKDLQAPGRISGVFVIAIDPAAFGDADHYVAITAATVAAVRQVKPAAGVAEVLVPGEPEIRSRAARYGVAMPEATEA